VDTIKTEDPNYARDVVSHAVINTNVNAFKQYKMQRNQGSSLDKVERALAQVQNESASLKQDIAEIKTLLGQLINGRINS
jgi:hypothetical protein